MNFTEVFASFVLSLLTNFIVMVGATSFFYWVNSSTATPFVVAHREPLALITGFGFMAYLFAQMQADAYYDHLQAGFHWTYLNMMILTMYILNLQLHLRWQALVDIGLIAIYFFGFGSQVSPLGIVALIIAALTLYATQAFAKRLVKNRLWKYGVFAVFAASVLLMQSQMSAQHTDAWFWMRQLLALAIMSVLCLEFEQIMRMTQHRTNHMATLTTIDELTGVRNFGTFNKELDERFAEYKKTGTPYSVFEGDLDHFKHINDTYGHPSGNIVLQRLALELEEFAKDLPFEASAYRLGGEEFAIIAQADLTYEQAMAIGERFQTLLNLVRFPEVDPQLIITCSIGQARVESGHYSANDVYKHADRNLYDAKQAGRNRVKAQADD
ncbi:GGDEF domain-containing protein [Lacticaseibacillus porcinae]|uniref:GGDEF domain-containing protein n=1 Tax=Lacticaseibacillus porcinae TaxID=1123687 RepID=UPI000F772B88|nr:GGDEF domain-containing protein [Lacticaseibacillus porcinae]